MGKPGRILISTAINTQINTYNSYMKKVSLVVLSLLLATFALYQFNSQQPTPSLQKEPIDYFGLNDECTKTLEIECAIDVERTVIACGKAF